MQLSLHPLCCDNPGLVSRRMRGLHDMKLVNKGEQKYFKFLCKIEIFNIFKLCTIE